VRLAGPAARLRWHQPVPNAEGTTAVKKLLVLLALAGAGAAVWRKFQGNRAEEDLWTEATRDETLDLR
jgi:hypothetical protein